MARITATRSNLHTIENRLAQEATITFQHQEALARLNTVGEMQPTVISSTQIAVAGGGFTIALNGLNFSPVGTAEEFAAAIQNGLLTGDFTNLVVTYAGASGTDTILTITPSLNGYLFQTGDVSLAVQGVYPTSFQELFAFTDAIENIEALFDLINGGTTPPESVIDDIVAGFSNFNFEGLRLIDGAAILFEITRSATEITLTFNGLSYTIEGAFGDNGADWARALVEVALGRDPSELDVSSLTVTNVATGRVLMEVVNDDRDTETFVIDGDTYGDFEIGTAGHDYFNINAVKNSDPYLISMGAGNDTVYGAQSRDVIFGGGGRDQIFGNGGNDRILGENGNDVIRGGGGRDTLLGGGKGDRLYGDGGGDVIGGGAGHDRLFGNNGNDRLDGQGGKDRLDGGRGADVLIGGLGKDRMVAGKDAAVDRFIFRNVNESGLGDNADRIIGFDRGEDLIDLSRVDANSAVSGNQTLAFSNEAAANSVWVTVEGSTTLVMVDVTGDGIADMSIAVAGSRALTVDDFIL